VRLEPAPQSSFLDEAELARDLEASLVRRIDLGEVRAEVEFTSKRTQQLDLLLEG
jgi:hypothetical protein